MAEAAIPQAGEPQAAPEGMDVDQPAKWSDEIAIRRYIFMRSLDPNFVNRQSLLARPVEHLDFGDNSVETHMRALAGKEDTRLMSIFVLTVDNKCLRTREQLLWCIAFCLRKLGNVAISNLLRREFGNYVKTSRDLLVFMHFYKFWGPRPDAPVLTEDNMETATPAVAVGRLSSGQKRNARRKKRKDGGSLTFSKGMRRCLTRWYESWSHDELIEILYATAAVHGIKHNDIIRQIHLFSVPKPKPDVHPAKKAKSFPKVEKPPVEPLTKLITDATSWRVKTLEEKAQEHKSEWIIGHKMRKVITYQHLKVTMPEPELITTLKKGKQNYNFKLNHLTPDGIKISTVSMILKESSLSEAIDILFTMNKRKMISTAQTVKDIMRKVEVSAKVIKGAHLNAFNVFQARQDLITRFKEFASCGKELDKEFEKAHEKLIAQLLKITEMSLEEFGASDNKSYYITLDFRNFSKRQAHVFGMTKVPCCDLQILFALWMLRNQKKVVLKAFTDERNKLRDIDWDAETTFEAAKAWYGDKENITTKRTKEHFVFPMQKAREDGIKVDVFIEFVSSIARTVGGNATPPLEELNKYREAQSQPKAKLIMINLTRQQPDFVYNKCDNSELGVLEILGFNVEGMKIIKGYVEEIFN